MPGQRFSGINRWHMAFALGVTPATQTLLPWLLGLCLVAAGAGSLVLHRRLRREQALRRQAEAQAAEARQLLHDIANELPVVVFQRVVGSPVSPFTFVGHGVKELLGCSAEELMRDPEVRWRCMHEDDLAWTRTWVEASLTHGIVGSIHFRTRVEGRVRWVEALTTATRRPDGTRVLHGAWRDITELVEAQHVARAAANAKSAFLANMSHEIRTPMNAILGMARLALASEMQERPRRYVQKMERAAQSLLGIIKDILDFSKIEAGKLDMERAPFDLHEVMDSLASMVGLQAEEKGLELVFLLPPEVPTALVGDALRLGQVLVNLGGNAVKFTDRGEVTLSVELLGRTEQRATLRFAVRDTGVGMDAAQRERLFRPFEQVDSSASRRHGGTGLGLAISSHLVRQMGGQMEVRSQPQQGSEFSFAAEFELQPQQPELRLPALQGRRLLLLDDHPGARAALTDMASSLGMVPECAQDGWDLLRRATLQAQAGQPYELALIDRDMPGMDGLQCAQQLGDALPVVLLTAGLNGDELLQRLQQAGAQRRQVLAKPVTPLGLRRACLQALGLAPPPAADADADEQGRPPQAQVLAGRRVLLVEDNLINQELAAELLQGAGMQVTVAENGQDALERLQRLDFDVVLMDCQMPVMDGYEATRAIRAQPRWAQLPVIAMTANAMASDRERAFAAGMDDHIAKPIDVPRMFEVLARWLGPGGTPRALVPPPPADPLSAVPGLDLAVGRASAGHNEPLYRRLLLRFREMHRSFGAQMQEALASDPVKARRLAHDLRSVAGALGMGPLSQAAGRLEEAAREGAGQAQALAAVLALLQPLIEALDRLPPTEPG